MPGSVLSLISSNAKLLFILPIILLLQITSAHSQKFFTAEKSYAVKLGRTKPLHDLIPMAPTDSLKLKIRKSNKPKYVPNFGGRRHLDFHLPSALPQGPDPLYVPGQMRSLENEILPVLNFEGIKGENVSSGVPDVNGDISRDYFVEIVNATHFKVYDKNGVALSNLISANTIWSQVQESSAGDPILLYDQEADRWLLTEFPPGNRVLLAISVTSDPRGSWDAYSFQTPRFPDFPKYGIWNNAYFLTTNESGANFPIYAFNRADMLAGADQVRLQRLTVPKNSGVFFEVGQPLDWDGMTPPPAGSPGIVVKLNDDDWGTTNQDHIMLHKIHIDWDSSQHSNIEILEIPTAPYDTDGCSLESTGGFSCVPQPNSQGIDGAQWIITNKAQYRNFGTHESFVMSFMVDVTGEDVAGIRWMEFRKTSSLDWHLYQEGTIGSDDGLHRFMSSIGIDGQGNIGIAYSVSGYNKHPSLRFTGRYATDPLGIMSFKEYEFASGNGSLGDDRFGDYASMSVDPSDDQTFWFAGEYIPTNGDWSTRIVAFRASRDTFDIFPISIIEPQNRPDLSSNEPLSVSILNRGLNTVNNFSLAYKFMDGTWVVEPANIDSLQVDSIYIHTFQTGLNFGAPGNFNLQIASILAIDHNHRNDTISVTVSKPAYRDVAIEVGEPGQQDVICSGNHVHSIILRNLGVDPIHSISIQVLYGSTPVDTFYWTGNLIFGQEELYQFETSDLTEGVNHVSVNILEINHQSDEIPSNNLASWTLTAKPSGIALFLHLLTDNFPHETMWELVDGSNQVIASDGPYSEQQGAYTSNFCLDPDACYSFIITDSFGDGMSAQGIQGHYEIVNDEGEIIAALSQPNFGTEDVNLFCLGSCMLELEVGVIHESMPGAGDAMVIGNVVNGLGDYSFTLDGINYQTENIFLNVPPGSYQMVVLDDAGCTDTVLFEVLTCSLQAMITTFPATGGDVGQIHISATGGIGPVLFSISEGVFVTDSFFIMLEPGDYIVTVRDSAGCEITDTVTISTQVGTTQIFDDSFIRINPNPGIGVFQILGAFPSTETFINYVVLTAAGEEFMDGSVVRYNDLYKGELSLGAYPSGTYYVMFFLDSGIAVKRIIKL